MTRKPPLPNYFNNPVPGICRWCNIPVTKILKNGKPSKSSWHDSCLIEYKLIHWPSYTRKAVWRRDRGICAQCKTTCNRKGLGGWNMDHIIPIHLSNGELWVWKLPNLQTLCHPCHKIKTANEATNRAISRRSCMNKPN